MKTQTCPTCHGNGKVPSGFRITAPAAGTAKHMRPLFSFQKVERDDLTIAAVDIPRKHALDFGCVAAIVGVAVCGLADGTVAECIYTGALSLSVVFGVVRAMGTVQDNGRVKQRDSLAASTIPQHAPPIPPAHTNTNKGYLPVYSAPKRDGHAVFKDFIRGCEEIGTSQNYWEQTRMMKRTKYTELRDLLIGLDWAGWVSPTARGQGWRMLFDADFIITGLFRGTTRDGRYAAPPH